jgi:hypothetical protein
MRCRPLKYLLGNGIHRFREVRSGSGLANGLKLRRFCAIIATSMVPAPSLSSSSGVISSATVTRACGYFRENLARIGGRKCGAIVGITPTEIDPLIDVSRSTTSLRAASRSRRNARPSSVSGTVRPRRLKSRAPNSSSSFRICCESEGSET